MLFKKFVELGRVIQITKGKYVGKLAVIVNIIDCNRLLVDGPGIHRCECKVKDARLLKFKIGHVTPDTKVKVLQRRWEANQIELRFNRMPFAMRQQKLQRRSEITDFGYFNMRFAMRKRSNIIHNAMNTILNKEPRTMLRLKRDFKDELNRKLGYKAPLTAEQKKAREAKKAARYAVGDVAKKAIAHNKQAARAIRAKELKAKRATKKPAAKTEKKEPKNPALVKVNKTKRHQVNVNKRFNRSLIRRQNIDKAFKKAAQARKDLHAKKPAVKSA